MQDEIALLIAIEECVELAVGAVALDGSLVARQLWSDYALRDAPTTVSDQDRRGRTRPDIVGRCRRLHVVLKVIHTKVDYCFIVYAHLVISK